MNAKSPQSVVQSLNGKRQLLDVDVRNTSIGYSTPMQCCQKMFWHPCMGVFVGLFQDRSFPLDIEMNIDQLGWNIKCATDI